MPPRRTVRRARKAAPHNFYEPALSAEEQAHLAAAGREGLDDEAGLLRVLILREARDPEGDPRLMLQELTLLVRVEVARGRLGKGIDPQLALDIAAEINRLAGQSEEEAGDA